jgi:hypothetical protein
MARMGIDGNISGHVGFEESIGRGSIRISKRRRSVTVQWLLPARKLSLKA